MPERITAARELCCAKLSVAVPQLIEALERMRFRGDHWNAEDHRFLSLSAMTDKFTRLDHDVPVAAAAS